MTARTPDRLSLVAGGVLCLLGTVLVLDQLEAFSLRPASAGAVLCAGAGLILIAWGLMAEPEPGPASPSAGGWSRDTEGGLVGGVLAGLARRIGADPTLLRVLFAVAVIVTGGLALVAYAIAWLLLPSGIGRGVFGAGGRRGRPGRGLRLGAGAGLLTLAGLLVFRSLGIWWSDALVWPLVLAAAGAALLWSQSRSRAAAESAPQPAAHVQDEPVAAEAVDERAGLVDLYRGGFGIALVLGAALLFLSQNDALGGARDAAFTAIVSILALALILAPFIWRLGRNLAAERAERIRSQERADLAAHLHDSVLQTLTLMQKRADDPREVSALARRQERELRSWLAGGAGDDGDSDSGFAAALRSAAEEVEDDHRVAIDVVTVGDAPCGERESALIAAAREAMTNAAKFAGGSSISAYAEADANAVEVYVRDRGPGFDPAAVPADRRGVSESIEGRMRRYGGSATITSGRGSGTEVALRIARDGEQS